MKRKILNSSLALLMIGSQFAPIVASAATANSSARWGVHSGITQMSQTYPYPTEAWEDLMKNAYGQASENSIYHRVMDLTQSLTDVAKSTLSTTLGTEGIVFNSSQKQSEVTSNLTWYGDDWSDQSRDDSGGTYPEYRKALLKSDLTGNSFEVKEYATYFNTATGETELLDMEVTVSYNDTTRLRSTGGVDVTVTPSGITWNKGGTDELVVETKFYKTGTSTVVDAPVMYHFTDFDNGGTIGVDNRQVYGVWSYLPTTTGAWADVYDTYDKDGEVFNFKVFFDQLTTAEQGIGVCSRYFTDTDRTKFQNVGNFGSSPSGNLTPSERGSGRIKFVNKGNYTAIVDGWSTNTGANNSEQDCTMTTNGQDGELVIVMDSTATITMSQMAAVVNYGIEDGSGDTLYLKPYNYQAVISVNEEAEGDEGVVRTDSELLNLMDVTYNTPTGYSISVDQSAIDYNTPGTYEVYFTNEADESEFTTTGLYTVNNVTPVIEGNDLVTVELGSAEETDFTTLYGLSSIDGTEVTTDDLTFAWKDEEPLVVDGKYAMTGDYTLVVTSKDDEGYEDVTKEVTLSIKRDVDKDTSAIGVGVGTIAPSVTGDSTTGDNEYTTHTDEELVEMFNIEANNDEYGWRSLSVDQSAIDYTTPGTYDVVFTVTENISKETATFTGSYEVIDVLPTITADDLVEVKLNDEEINYQAMFDVVATEINEGDLNLDVTVTPDEDILLSELYNTYIMTGTFDITFTVEDNEGNVASTTSTLKVSRDFETEYAAMTSEVEVVDLELSADSLAGDYEGTTPSDSELLEMFNVVGNDDTIGFRTITIDDSAVDYNTPGTYDIVFTITEAISKETKDVVSTYEVYDALPVVVADDYYNVTIGDSVIDYIDAFNVEATELKTNDILSSVEVTFDDDLLVVDGAYAMTGSFDITFTATDDEGNEVSQTSTLNVKRNLDQEVTLVDKGQLTLELDGDENASTPEGTELTDKELIKLFNIEANNDNDGVIQLSVNQNTVDYDKPGIYKVMFTLTNTINGGSTTLTTNLTVEDILPTITVNPSMIIPEGTQDVEYKSLYNVSATELEDNDLYDSISYDASEVDTNTEGDYPVYFEVGDDDGNVVDVETQAQVINFSYAGYEGTVRTAEELQQSINLESFGATNVVVHSDVVDFDKPGIYNVPIDYEMYGVTYQMEIEYEVIDILPTIRSNSYMTGIIDEPQDYMTALNVRATEKETGDLTDRVVIDDSDVDWTQEGEYNIEFEVTDDEGNVATTWSVLYVSDDTPEYKFESDAYDDEGIELTYDQLISAFNISCDGVLSLAYDIDFDTPGEYDVEMSCANSSTGKTLTETLTYHVTDILPEIIGNGTYYTTVGVSVSDYVNLYQVVASELSIGDLTSTVEVDDSKVDFYTAGEYDITFTATDNEGNEAELVSKLIVNEEAVDYEQVTVSLDDDDEEVEEVETKEVQEVETKQAATPVEVKINSVDDIEELVAEAVEVELTDTGKQVGIIVLLLAIISGTVLLARKVFK